MATRTRSMLTPALAVLAACLLPLASCGRDPGAGREAPDEGRLTVVATIGMVADIAREVAGERADVTPLIAPGIDPHLFTPTRSDVQRLMNADLVLFNGHLLEGKLTPTLERAAQAGAVVVPVAERVDASRLILESESEPDPHLWMDPSLWMLAVEAVRDALVVAEPANTEAYRANAEAYLTKLRELDAYAAGVLATVPESSRVLVTAHDAFNYFGRRFGFEVVGIQGISTESEAGVRDIERLVDLLVTRNVPAVFVETTVSQRNINALIEGARARGHTVIIGGELFSDAMGPADTYEGTYVGMIDHNVTTIARALGGQAPPRGMQNLLAE